MHFIVMMILASALVDEVVACSHGHAWQIFPGYVSPSALKLRGGATSTAALHSLPDDAEDVDKEAFGFYKLLGVERDASQAEIKTSYRRLAIAAHPDRNPTDGATAKFQTLQRVYEVLADPEQRRLYDETGGKPGNGSFGELFGGMSFADLYVYFRDMFKKVTEEDIVSYQQEYRGLQAEKDDLRNYYERFRGDITQITSFIPFSEDEDVQRFRLFFSHEVDAKRLPNYPAFKKWRFRKTNPLYHDAAAAAPPPAPLKNARAQASELELRRMILESQAKRAEAASRLAATLTARLSSPPPISRIIAQGKGQREAGRGQRRGGAGGSRRGGSGRGRGSAGSAGVEKKMSLGVAGESRRGGSGRGRGSAGSAGVEKKTSLRSTRQTRRKAKM